MTAEPRDLAVGDEVEVEVGPVAHGGHCVARHEGRVVFVRHTLPGERVRVRITDARTGQRFVRGDAVEVLDASPHRVPAPCPYSVPGLCGGCDFQHVALAEQRRLKAAVIREQFARLASMARLARVKNVGTKYVAVLLAAGIDGPKSLFEYTPESLVKRSSVPI